MPGKGDTIVDGSQTKTEAQHRADRIRAFEEELAQAEAEGAAALTDGQRQGLADYCERLLSGGIGIGKPTTPRLM